MRIASFDVTEIELSEGAVANETKWRGPSTLLGTAKYSHAGTSV
jgi:hypothetical protein